VVVPGLVLGAAARELALTSSARWFVFLTNWSGLVLALHCLLDAGQVVQAYRRGPPGTMAPGLRLAWAVQATAQGSAAVVTVVYWAALHPALLREGLLDSWPGLLLLALPGHTLNSLACLLDGLLSARPTRPAHFWPPLLLGLAYAATNLTYWAAGGLGLCAVRCPAANSSLAVSRPSFLPPGRPHTVRGCGPAGPCGRLLCDSFLYPVLDWSCRPGAAAAWVLGLALLLPLLQVGPGTAQWDSTVRCGPLPSRSITHHLHKKWILLYKKLLLLHQKLVQRTRF
jgi:hypothetical protein